jgi:sulfate adenylyltransferase subunit 1
VSELLRFATAGSVDDGKSTLIGRLLYDAKAVLADQLEHVEDVSARRGGEGLDLALLTDGLRAEREQGITIDVAYRYFATGKRRFIIADTPGHAQYTRNMVTGASTADLALILIDVRHGMTEQSRRHATIAHLLGIHHLVVAVNKMDLVDFAEESFDAVVREFLDFSSRLGIEDVTFIPISALRGDNVVERSANTPWYSGEPLLGHLETVPVAVAPTDQPARLPVQLVIRPGSDGRAVDRRYAGRLEAGVLRTGEEVLVLPSGERARITRIEGPAGELDEAISGLSLAVCLDRELDIARGNMIAHVDDAPAPRRELEATVCWLGDRPAQAGDRMVLKHTTRTVRARIDAIPERLDVISLESAPADQLSLNEIGRVRLRLGEEIMGDPYEQVRETGAFILIDEATNETVGAGMIAA